MNIVDRLVPSLRDPEPEFSLEEKTRHDVLFSQIRYRTGLPAENIDLSGVDFSIDDDTLRAQIAKERGIKSDELAATIDLDEIIIPSGAALRRGRRKAQRAQAKRKRRGQRRFNRQVRQADFADGVTESGSARVKRLRLEKAAVLAIGERLKAMQAEAAGDVHRMDDAINPRAVEDILRSEGHPAILALDTARAA